MIFKPSSLHKFFFTYICPRFYGGGSPPPAPTQTTQTVNQNTIPEQLMPYVKNMLNRAEPLSQSAYKPYSTNAADYVAPFSPLQKQAQAGAAKLQTPGQFAPASQMAGLSGIGQIGTAGQAAGVSGQAINVGQNYAQQATNPNAVGAYMNPYLQQSLAPQLQLLNQQFGIKGAQQQGAATQAGAFGGSREALSNAMTNQGQALAQQEMIGQGYNQAFGQAQQAQQFGANLGLQGYQTGLQGLQTAQQGFTGAANTAATLGNLGTAQLGAQTSVLGTQAQFGGQQQAQQQQAINQAIQNYQNAQNYPYMQLGFMSNLLRGTPIGNTTQTTYMAQPGMASQLGGLAATGLGAYSALKAEGGAIKDKGYAKGGIVGYKLGGDIEESMRSKLEDLDIPHLQQVAQNKESPKMASIAKEVLATKYATGGIVAFAEGEDVKDKKKLGGINDLGERPQKMLEMKEQADKVEPQYFIPNEEILPSPAASITTNAAPIIPAQTESVTPLVQAPQAMQTPFNAPMEAKAPTETTENPLKGILAAQEENVAASEKEANKSVEERVKEIADLKEKMLGKDTETAEYRKSLMEEKANSKDELRRQMGMRLMEFGANWASTPGAPLVAGMKALKESLPSVMQDTKENKKLMKDIDKSIYLLNHSERLDAEGKIDAAAKARQDASGIVMANKTKLTDFAMDKYKIEETARLQEKQIEATLEGHKISAGATVEAAKIRGADDKNGLTGNARAVALDAAISRIVKKRGLATKEEKKMLPIYQEELNKVLDINTPTTDLQSNILPVGTKKNGYTYKGGNPNSESSWSKD